MPCSHSQAITASVPVHTIHGRARRVVSAGIINTVSNNAQAASEKPCRCVSTPAIASTG